MWFGLGFICGCLIFWLAGEIVKEMRKDKLSTDGKVNVNPTPNPKRARRNG